jgi:four helix bundle protein
LSRLQFNDFDKLVRGTTLSKDFELRNQMNASSGSVMDCIAEGFERSGNAEFKNFLIIAKGSNGEFRSQLHRCLDRKYITPPKFDELYQKNVMLGNKIMSLSITFKILILKVRLVNQRSFPANNELRISNVER